MNNLLWWVSISKKMNEGMKAPCCLYSESVQGVSWKLYCLNKESLEQKKYTMIACPEARYRVELFGRKVRDLSI